MQVKIIHSGTEFTINNFATGLHGEDAMAIQKIVTGGK
jgi:hypothetical protein